MSRYIVSAVTSPFGEPVDYGFRTDDPEKAIEKWFIYNKDYPTCVDIQAKTDEDGRNLLKWADLNLEKLEVMMKDNKCPYKTDWLKEQISARAKSDRKTIQWEYDSVYPFCMG